MKLFFSAQRWYLNSKHILLNKKTLKFDDDPWIFEPNNVDKDFLIQNKKTKKFLAANSFGIWFDDIKEEEKDFLLDEQLWSKRWTDHTYFILENRTVTGVLTSISKTAFPVIKGNITLMPCPFTGPKMFCAGPIFFCQTKNLFTYCGSHKHFVPDKKMICIQ